MTKAQQKRTAVHFLVNMLEAYYFADSNALKLVLNIEGIKDYEGDVETIKHPKNELKRIFSSFNEKDDGGRIIENLNVEHILSNPYTCAWLRTLFLWCVKILAKCSYCEIFELNEKFCLQNGVKSPVTINQINNI